MEDALSRTRSISWRSRTPYGARLYTLTGAGLAVALIGAGACLLAMGGYATNSWLHAAGGVGGLVALVAALAAWLFRWSPWRVQRIVVP